MQTHQGVSLLLLSFAMGLAHAAPPSYPEYRVTIVGPANSRPVDINNAGAVIGTFQTGPNTTRGFVSQGKSYVALKALGTSSDASGINDKGEVVGNWLTKSGQSRGFIYANGRQRDIGVIEGRGTGFRGINNAGYTIALVSPADPLAPSPRSYLRAPKGKAWDIGTVPAENPVTIAQALNNRNQITGESGSLFFPEQPFRAFLWSKGVMRDLGDFGETPNVGMDINDRGQVTGSMAVPGFHDQVAFIYSNGRLINIDPAPPTVERFSTGEGINNYGHVVGTSQQHGAFVYRGRRMESLNALIDRRSGWTISFPRAINDAGQIAAWGDRNGVTYTVRLDLIRPHGMAAPHIEADEGEASTAK